MGSSSRHERSRPERTRPPRAIGFVAAGVALVAIVVLGVGFGGGASNAASDVTGGVGRTLGRADAPVKLDLWADFKCPTCGVFNARIEPRLVEAYINTGKAMLTFHDMAFIGPDSLDAAIGARCADRQGRFWPFHDVLFAHQGPEQETGTFAPDRLARYAATVGLDLPSFSGCLADPSVEQLVRAATARAYAIHIKETPTLRVNGTAVSRVMHWPTVAAAIDAALTGSRPGDSASRTDR